MSTFRNFCRSYYNDLIYDLVPLAVGPVKGQKPRCLTNEIIGDLKLFFFRVCGLSLVKLRKMKSIQIIYLRNSENHTISTATLVKHCFLYIFVVHMDSVYILHQIRSLYFNSSIVLNIETIICLFINFSY